jgi:hypothetical protein
MKQLSHEAQARAKAFVEHYARPLEQRIYAYYYRQGPKEAIFEALATFQNPDGGFGNALEPDLRLPDSSVLATTVGLQVLREFDAPADHPLVRGALHYLLQTYNPAAEAWSIIPPNTDDAPHAPWWTYGEDVAASWNNFLVNPRVEIIGYLLDYAPSGLPAWVRRRLVDAVGTYLDEHPDKIGMFDLLCYDRLIKTRTLPEDTRAMLIAKLTPLVDQLVIKDPAEWEKYNLMPLELVNAPDSPFAAVLGDVVAQNLDFEIDRQHADGSWKPKWTWGPLYPDVWEQAKQDWSGVITLRTLKALRNFGRLA